MRQWLIIFLLVLIASCGGGSSPSTDPGLDPLPEFTPSTEDLASLVVNTFAENGSDITVDPQYINFNDTEEEIELNDTTTSSFILTNNTAATQSFQFAMYSISGGFSILDENDQPVDGWTLISIDAGSSKTFQAKFNALTLGMQTSYVTITATGLTGYIRFPLRATVSGAANMHVIPTGYLCSDNNAPTISELDYLKVATGQTVTRGVKICNTGGETIKIYSAQIINAESVDQSAAFDSNSYEEFLWSVTDTIDSSFAFGTTPETTASFIAPTLIDSGVGVETPISNFSVAEYGSGHSVDDISLAAGSLLRMDVNFSPTLEAEAPEGSLYNAIPVNATLAIETSLGAVHIPLLGATSGTEPILKLSYRFPDSDTWREIDLTSNSTALYFGMVDIFKDWVANNSQTVEIKVENVGTGSKSLEFYGGTINGFFEYIWDDESPLTFPLVLSEGGDPQTFKIRYLPSASDELDEDYEKQWNFGQFYFQHTGGNGPSGKVLLVGEQDAGYAVELYLGGSALEHTYDSGQTKNMCVISNNAASPTTKTFTVKNNNKADSLHVEWSVDSSTLSATPAEGYSNSFDVEPNAETDFAIDFVALSESEGENVTATLYVTTSFVNTESLYGDYADTLDTPRSFSVPLSATTSATGTSTLCGGTVLGEADTMNVTMIMDRITMTMPYSLSEPLRNHPAFKFHWPIEINRERGTVRIPHASDFIYDSSSPDFNPIRQIRSYTHQATSVSGCAPLSNNPYRLEFEKRSWTGEGLTCPDNATITFSKRQSDGTTESYTFDSDTACLPNNGAESNTDPDGTVYTVFYHDLIQFNDCNVQYYGKIANFAFKEGTDYTDVLETAEASPNENDAFYEGVYGAFQHGSYIVFLQATTCGGIQKNAGDEMTDPDEIKEFYQCLSSNTNATRTNGFLDECSYFNFTIDEGVEPADADSDTPDTDSWTGFGTYEPYADEDGDISPTKYDLTIYNAHFKALILSAGDRVKFLGHQGHLIYTDFYVTVTTKPVASPNATDGSDWQERIAVNTRPHFQYNQVYMKDGDLLKLSDFWTTDGMNSELGNVIDETGLESGIDNGGFGKGIFRYTDDSKTEAVLSGWPINYDENNLLVLVGLGAFTGKGNTAPNYARADSATGIGKALYFAFHGCLVAGEPDQTQGCFDYHLDNATMPNGEPVITDYLSTDVLPGGYTEDCTSLADPGFADRYDESYMACINYKIMPQDRDRLTNYYSTGNRFEYEDNSYYNSTKCGWGM